jgi:hypothetical protein
LPIGWAFAETGGTSSTGARVDGLYTGGPGNDNTADTYSYGARASTDRAFGTLLSGSLVSTIGASFTNSTGKTVTDLEITYTGEQWRLGTIGRADRLDFQYSTGATSLTT